MAGFSLLAKHQKWCSQKDCPARFVLISARVKSAAKQPQWHAKVSMWRSMHAPHVRLQTARQIIWSTLLRLSPTCW